MTSKVYKSAMGKTVDMGSLLLQNEQVRAVGNMNVNARGDRLDSNNQVVEPKNRQVQRRYNKQTNVSDGPAATSTREVKQAQAAAPTPPVDPADTFADLPEDTPVDSPVDTPAPVVQEPADTPAAPRSAAPTGGLAGAIARTREVKQELEKTRRQQEQSQGLKRF
jgi:hypothetical protein